MNYKTAKIFLIPAIFFAVFLVFGNEARAATDYYVSPSGSDTNSGLATVPWATFAKAMTVLQPGDTLLIKNGTYYQTLNVTVSGSSGTPITIRAENDGQVVVDGESARIPLNVGGRSYIDIEGIIVKNSNSHVVYAEHIDHINFRRVSAYNSGSSGNNHIWDVAYASNVLIEDCVGAGTGRTTLTLYGSSSGNVIRRFYGRWTSYPDQWRATMQLYASSNTIVENVVLTSSSSSQPSAGLVIGESSAWIAKTIPSMEVLYITFLGMVLIQTMPAESNTHSLTYIQIQ